MAQQDKLVTPSLSKILRDLGDKAARETADAGDIPLVEARNNLFLMREAWAGMKDRREIPKDILIREFRIGWKGSEMGKHGTTTTYMLGCRCAACRKAASLYQKKYKRRKKEEAERKLVESYRRGVQEALQRLTESHGVFVTKNEGAD